MELENNSKQKRMLDGKAVCLLLFDLSILNISQ